MWILVAAVASADDSPRPEPQERWMPVAEPVRRAPAWELAPPLSEATGQPRPPRSPKLALAGLGAGVVSAGLLGGASALRTSYLDTPKGQAERSTYNANRVLGHAGYAFAVAGGALVLGSVSLGEWR